MITTTKEQPLKNKREMEFMKKKQRTFRNIIMIIMIAALAMGTYLTVDSAKDSVSSSGFMQMMGEMPSGAPNGNSSDSSDSSSSNQPPSMPSGDNQSGSTDGQPPTPPSGDNQNGNTNSTDSSDSNSSNQPPSMPSGDNQSGSTDGQPPTPPSGDNQNGNTNNADSTDSSDSSSSNQPPSMPSGGFPQAPQMNGGKSLSTWYYVAFAVESFGMAAIAVYLILSGFNKKGLTETLKGGKRILIFALASIIIASAITFADVTSVSVSGRPSFSAGEMNGLPNGGNNSSESVDASGATTVDGKEETLGDSYTSTESDESAILVTNGGNATITGTVDKKSGDSSNTENSEFYGVNAGVLVQANSTATIDGATISTSAGGANAVFSTGENSKIYVKNTTIKTTGERSSRGLDATYGGYIEADSVTITTQGGSCAALATDRGEGTVIANNSTLTTNGAGSPVIYSTGDISIDNTKGTANGAQMVVIEGKNSATVTNSTLVASGAGNRGDVDKAGIMIYQSMSGDASEGTGTFTAKNSSLSISEDSDVYKSAPMFFITNTDAVINLSKTELSYGSGILISAKGTDEWGNSGSNGGNVTLNAENQTLEGNVEIDSISTASINLTASEYTGTINGENTAKSVALKLDKDSTITLTGDSYVTSLDNADSTNSNINFNGYTLYVNGTAVK